MEDKEDRTEDIIKFWDGFAHSYEDQQEIGSLQSAIILYNFCKPRKDKDSADTIVPSKILEVGVASGKAARIYMSTFMKPGSYYFNTDISSEMIELYMKRFEESDLAYSPKIKVQKIDSEEQIAPQSLVDADSDEKVNRHVYSLVANNEKLPFCDNSFDCYIANLSLMLVNDHLKMLSESYRVLEEGGVAGFSVWGLKENTQFFTFMPEILERNGITMPEAKHTNFHLNDKDKLKKDILDAGFKDPKLFYAPNNKPYFDAEITYNFYASSPSNKKLLDPLSAEKVAEIKSDFISEFNSRFGPESTQPLTFEVLIAIAWK